jgi:putative transposase
MVPQRRFRSNDVLAVLADLFVEHGAPEHMRSDNGPEFAARAVRDWLGKVGVKTLFIEPGSPWENGYIESFNARSRNELLDGEIFYTLEEVRVISGWWRATRSARAVLWAIAHRHHKQSCQGGRSAPLRYAARLPWRQSPL